MPIVVEKTLYLFNELSDDAKECARNWWRAASSDDNYWSESVIDDAATCADILGIDLRQTRKTRVDGSHFYDSSIYWSGFWSQDDGACFESKYRYAKGSCDAIRKHAPLDTDLHDIADALRNIQRRQFYKLEASTSTGHRNNMRVSVEHAECSCRDIGTAESDIAECLNDFAHWIYRQLEKEYEWQNADAQVDDAMQANEYTFDIDGNSED